jgi:transcription elongation regulator 1
MKERRDVYEEYCRTAGRAKRTTKAPEAAKKADPEKEYRALMREEVTSTRTRFDDFRRKFKKDRRFWAYGRDDREREKAFKVHLRELGERKRADAERAEKDFIELLSEADITPESEWSSVKKGISHDPRYDAVGSSTLRAELFATHLKKLAAGEPEDPAARRAREKKERQEASLAQRQNAVRAHQAVIGEEASKARRSAGREEGERLFGSLLVDVVRSDTTWEEVLPVLQQDHRYSHPALREGDKRRVFEGHIERIRETKADALSSLFAQNSTLETEFGDIYDKIAEDPLVQRLGLGAGALEERFNAWKRAREMAARAEFYELLRENNFVEFWGRMRNKVLDETATKVKQDEEDVEEGMDVTALAKQVDLAEIKSILRRDKRYRQFDHIAEERETWLRVSPPTHSRRRADPRNTSRTSRGRRATRRSTRSGSSACSVRCLCLRACSVVGGAEGWCHRGEATSPRPRRRSWPATRPEPAAGPPV